MERTIAYLKKNHINLSQDEIRELFKDKEKNENKIMRSQLALVMQLAQRYQHFNQKKTFEEVVSDCMEGLMKAMNYYNPIEHPDADFTGYAHTIIKQTMYHYKDENSIIKPSVRARRGQLREDELYVTTTKFEDMKSNEGDSNFLEIYQEPQTGKLIEDSDRYIKLCNIINNVFKNKPRYADIIIANFGLYGMNDKITLEEIGDMFAISKQAINQIKQTGIEKLKNNKEFIEYLKQTYYE